MGLPPSREISEIDISYFFYISGTLALIGEGVDLGVKEKR